MTQRIMQTIIAPTLAGMRADARAYQGFLYAGVMIDAAGVPRVLEFNCRMGDPETQPIMMRLQTDLVTACLAVLDGRAASVVLDFDARATVGVVLAAGGYPGDYAKGVVIALGPAILGPHRSRVPPMSNNPGPAAVHPAGQGLMRRRRRRCRTAISPA